MNKQLLLIVASSFLLSCADSNSNITTHKTNNNAHKLSPINVKYTCTRDLKLSINFTSKNNDSDNKMAIINGFGQQAIILPNKAVASGFLYSNGKHALRGKGEQVTWTVGRMMPFQCSIGDRIIPKENVK